MGGLIFYGWTGPVKKLREITVLAARPLMSVVSITRNILGSSSAENSSQDVISIFRFEIEKLKQENEYLKKALRFKEENNLSLIGAHSLLYSNNVGKEYLIIDQGREAGVMEGDLVVDGKGILVGKIFEVGGNFSKVGFASNAGETFEAEILPLNVRTVARGLGGRTFSLELISADSVLHQGDLVLLSEIGYPKVLLGQIASVERSGSVAFQEVGAVFLGRPEKLSEVFILVKK